MLRYLLLLAFLLVAGDAAAALDAGLVSKLAHGDGDGKSAAIGALVASGDPQAAVLLKALADGELQTAGPRVLIVKGESATDAATGEAVTPLPDARDRRVDAFGTARKRLQRDAGCFGRLSYH